MSKIKLSDLTELTAPSSNTKNTFFIVTDIQTGTPVSKKMSAFTLDTLLDVSQGQANLAFNHANSAFVQANSAFLAGNGTAIAANTPSHVANSAAIYANGAFAAANAATATDTTQNNSITAAFNHANSSFDSQNTTGQYANAAFTRANNSLSANVGGTITGDVSITGNLTVTGVTTYVNTQTVLVADNILTLNAAVNQSGSPISDAGVEIDRGNEANVYLLWNETSNKWTFTNDGTSYDEIGSTSASSYANSAFIQVNSAFDIVNASAGIDVTQNNSIIASFIHANSAFDATNAAAGIDATQNNSITASFIHANSGFDFSNVVSNIALSFSATTILEVLNQGTSAYRFTQYGALDNPNVTTFSATTLGFKLNISGHPFHIRTGDDTADYNTGLVHVATDGTLSYDSAAQGKSDGTLFWRIPHTAVGNYKYRCANHPLVMLGDINIANTANIYFAHNT